MIVTFKDKNAASIFEGKRVAKFALLETAITRKLQLLDSARTLHFLKSPPGNRLEALSGNRKGQHSIRINDQWRICFIWTDDGPSDVEIVDYH
jgi:proteic killer suppression protein